MGGAVGDSEAWGKGGTKLQGEAKRQVGGLPTWPACSYCPALRPASPRRVRGNKGSGPPVGPGKR